MALVRIPINPAPSKVDGDSDAERQKILYVEDEDDNFVVAEFALRDRFELIRARTTLEACDILRTQSFEIILMDIQLSGSDMNGIELTQCLRGIRTENIPKYAAGVDIQGARIIIVTAYAARYSEADVLRVGGDELITKPVDFGRLSRAIANLLVREAFEPNEQSEHNLRRVNRIEERKAVRVKMRMECFVGVQGHEHAAQIWDVSAAGARVRFLNNVPVEHVAEGTLCRVTFSTAWGFVESQATIVWMKKLSCVEIGIAFKDMESEAQQMLIRELSKGAPNKP